MFNSTVGQAAQLGQITPEQWWQRVGQQFGLSESELVQFEQDFWAADQLCQPIVDLLPVLRQQYRLGIISNHAANLRDWLHSTYPIAQYFDTLVISSEEGVCKPDAEIFQRACQRLAVQPNECVLIDDFTHNLAGARALGWTAIHYTPRLDLATALRQIGVIC